MERRPAVSKTKCQEVSEAAVAPFRAIRPGPGGSRGAGGAGSRPSSGCSQPPGFISHRGRFRAHAAQVAGTNHVKTGTNLCNLGCMCSPGRMGGCPGHRGQGLTSWHCSTTSRDLVLEDLVLEVP